MSRPPRPSFALDSRVDCGIRVDFACCDCLLAEVGLEGCAEGMGEAAREGLKEEVDALVERPTVEDSMSRVCRLSSMEIKRRLRGRMDAAVVVRYCWEFMATKAQFALMNHWMSEVCLFIDVRGMAVEVDFRLPDILTRLLVGQGEGHAASRWLCFVTSLACEQASVDEDEKVTFSHYRMHM